MRRPTDIAGGAVLPGPFPLSAWAALDLIRGDHEPEPDTYLRTESGE